LLQPIVIAVLVLAMSAHVSLAQQAAPDEQLSDSQALVDEVPVLEPQQPLPIPTRGGPLFRSRTPQDVAELARTEAAARMGVPVEQVQVLSMEPTEWPDTGLGCPHPGFRFAEVTIPGYIVQLDVAGTALTYHTDAGLRAIACDALPDATIQPPPRFILEEPEQVTVVD
jgi:hypothetical protein